MLSHIVVFWLDPAATGAADELVAAADRLLKPIPGLVHFHIGKMVPSERPIVEQTYQVALNLVFPDIQTHDAYQVHAWHVEFVEKFVKTMVKKVVIYDFA